MDFNLHFGRLFGAKIDFFKELALPDFELQHYSRLAKIVIFPRGKYSFFTKLTFWL